MSSNPPIIPLPTRDCGGRDFSGMVSSPSGSSGFFSRVPLVPVVILPFLFRTVKPKDTRLMTRRGSVTFGLFFLQSPHPDFLIHLFRCLGEGEFVHVVVRT